jgi:hypothetical protein
MARKKKSWFAGLIEGIFEVLGEILEAIID